MTTGCMLVSCCRRQKEIPFEFDLELVVLKLISEKIFIGYLRLIKKTEYRKNSAQQIY
jgi:hypothetical protein